MALAFTTIPCATEIFDLEKNSKSQEKWDHLTEREKEENILQVSSRKSRPLRLDPSDFSVALPGLNLNFSY